MESDCLCWKPKWSSGGGGDRQAAPASAAALVKPNPMSNSGGHQQKKAVLCGVSYQKKKKHKLKGTINDVKKMKSLLVECFGFPENAICVLTEEDNDPDLIPTKMNMQRALKWLVEDNKSGDSLVFYFSGHGLRQPDFDKDETDDYDETICPADFTTAGMILDNYINDTIVKPLNLGVKLHAIIDACHSGTILDLQHVYNPKTKEWVDNNPSSSVASKSTNGGVAICLSACADNQMAADTNAFTGKEMTGAMTYIFDEAIRKNRQITYHNLLDKIYQKIEDVNKAGCLNSLFLNKVFRNKFIQEPQLSSSQVFNVDAVVDM